MLWRYSLIIGNRRCTSGSDLYTGEGVVSDAREYDQDLLVRDRGRGCALFVRVATDSIQTLLMWLFSQQTI